MNMKKLYLLCVALPILAGCQMAQICDNKVSDDIGFEGFKFKKGDNATLLQLNKLGAIENKYTSPIISYDKRINTTNVMFNASSLSGKNIYKLTYNQDVFFFYDFKVSSKKKMAVECLKEPQYKVNDCKNNGNPLDLNYKCSVPASEADAYFKKYVQPTMK